MNKKLNKIFFKTEFYIAIAIIILSFIVQMRSGQFFTGNNLVDLSRALIIPAMFCICEMMVLISGGTDVSFPAIAALAMYIVSTKMSAYTGNIAMFLLAGALLGLIMGALNGFIIAYFNFPTLIVTLGTTSLFSGIMYGPFAAQEYPAPSQMIGLGKSNLFTVVNSSSGLKSDMPITVLFLIALLIFAWFILKKTMLGRGIYAIGGDRISAERAGFNVFKIQMFIYCFSGLMAGFIGVVRSSMMQNVNPTNLNGMEMTVIAACVLGGVSVTGGKGTIFGTMLGITLMTIMSNSLILIGVPTYWQKVFTGAIILVGTGVTAYKQLQNKDRLSVNIIEEGAANAANN